MNRFLLMTTFEGLDVVSLLDDHAQGIHDEYMRRYGAGTLTARTLFFLRLQGEPDLAVLYEGPDESVTWLEEAIRTAVESTEGSVTLRTVQVVDDLTDTYSSSSSATSTV